MVGGGSTPHQEAPMLTILTTAVMLATVAPANDVTADKADVQITLGSGVENREAIAFEEGHSPSPGDTVYAWMLIKNFSGDSIEQVWTRDGTEVARHKLSVGSARRWRSWSHQRVRAGTWEVRALAADGSELAKQTFTVSAAVATDEH
jgi:hypothetical protein